MYFARTDNPEGRLPTWMFFRRLGYLPALTHHTMCIAFLFCNYKSILLKITVCPFIDIFSTLYPYSVSSFFILPKRYFSCRSNQSSGWNALWHCQFPWFQNNAAISVFFYIVILISSSSERNSFFVIQMGNIIFHCFHYQHLLRKHLCGKSHLLLL